MCLTAIRSIGHRATQVQANSCSVFKNKNGSPTPNQIATSSATTLREALSKKISKICPKLPSEYRDQNFFTQKNDYRNRHPKHIIYPHLLMQMEVDVVAAV